MMSIGANGGPLVTPLHRQTAPKETIGQQIHRETTGIDSRKAPPGQTTPLAPTIQPAKMPAQVAQRLEVRQAQAEAAKDPPRYEKEPVRAETIESRFKIAGRPEDQDRIDDRYDRRDDDRRRAKETRDRLDAAADRRADARAERAERPERTDSERPEPASEARYEPPPKDRKEPREIPPEVAARRQFDATLKEVRAAQNATPPDKPKSLDTAM